MNQKCRREEPRHMTGLCSQGQRRTKPGCCGRRYPLEFLDLQKICVRKKRCLSTKWGFKKSLLKTFQSSFEERNLKVLISAYYRIETRMKTKMVNTRVIILTWLLSKLTHESRAKISCILKNFGIRRPCVRSVAFSHSQTFAVLAHLNLGLLFTHESLLIFIL